MIGETRPAVAGQKAGQGAMQYSIEPVNADGSILIRPIGLTRSSVREEQTGGFEGLESSIEIDPKYADFLAGLGDYSHLIVITWLSEQTRALPITQPQGNPEAPCVGMFACR